MKSAKQALYNIFNIGSQSQFFFPANLSSVIFTLYGVDGRARSGLKERVKLGIFAESTRVAEKWIFLVVVDGSTLVALVDVLPACPTHSWVGRDRRLAPGTLKNLRTSLQAGGWW